MKTAIITGANRGLGLEFVRQLRESGYHVIGTCRCPDEAIELSKIAHQVFKLDVTQDEDINQLVDLLQNKPIDLLINNAGISGKSGVTIGNIDRENFLNVLNVNCVSVVKVCDALLRNIESSSEKFILVISSRMSSIADNDIGRSYAYRSSKAALNCVMRSFAIDVQNKGIKVMLMHPGWVKTRMGGENAPLEASESVSKILEQIKTNYANISGDKLYSFDSTIIPW